MHAKPFRPSELRATISSGVRARPDCCTASPLRLVSTSYIPLLAASFILPAWHRQCVPLIAPAPPACDPSWVGKHTTNVSCSSGDRCHTKPEVVRISSFLHILSSFETVNHELAVCMTAPAQGARSPPQDPGVCEDFSTACTKMAENDGCEGPTA